MPEKKLYMIGGGDNESAAMEHHHQRIVDIAKEGLSSDESPRIALIPTAHRNGLHAGLPHRDFFRERFESLGCIVHEILIGDLPRDEQETSPADINALLDAAHAIFVANGDTRYMLNQFRTHGLDLKIVSSYESGTLLAGSSAGCIMIGEKNMSDSASYDDPNQWQYIELDGLGILPGYINAHDDQGARDGETSGLSRQECFDVLLSEGSNKNGLAIPEHVALEIRDRVACVVIPDGIVRVPQIVSRSEGSTVRTDIVGEIDIFTALTSG